MLQLITKTFTKGGTKTCPKQKSGCILDRLKDSELKEMTWVAFKPGLGITENRLKALLGALDEKFTAGALGEKFTAKEKNAWIISKAQVWFHFWWRISTVLSLLFLLSTIILGLMLFPEDKGILFSRCGGNSLDNSASACVSGQSTETWTPEKVPFLLILIAVMIFWVSSYLITLVSYSFFFRFFKVFGTFFFTHFLLPLLVPLLALIVLNLISADLLPQLLSLDHWLLFWQLWLLFWPLWPLFKGYYPIFANELVIPFPAFRQYWILALSSALLFVIFSILPLAWRKQINLAKAIGFGLIFLFCAVDFYILVFIGFNPGFSLLFLVETALILGYILWWFKFKLRAHGHYLAYIRGSSALKHRYRFSTFRALIRMDNSKEYSADPVLAEQAVVRVSQSLFDSLAKSEEGSVSPSMERSLLQTAYIPMSGLEGLEEQASSGSAEQEEFYRKYRQFLLDIMALHFAGRADLIPRYRVKVTSLGNSITWDETEDMPKEFTEIIEPQKKNSYWKQVAAYSAIFGAVTTILSKLLPNIW